MNSKFIFLISMVLGVFFFISTPACKKTADPGKAIITVVDSVNKPVFGATVYLNSDNNPVPGEIKDKKITDNNGKTYHEFPLEMILQVEVNKGAIVAPKSNIHIIPGETATLTVRLK